MKNETDKLREIVALLHDYVKAWEVYADSETMLDDLEHDISVIRERNKRNEPSSSG